MLSDARFQFHAAQATGELDDAVNLISGFATCQLSSGEISGAAATMDLLRRPEPAVVPTYGCSLGIAANPGGWLERVIRSSALQWLL